MHKCVHRKNSKSRFEKWSLAYNLKDYFYQQRGFLNIYPICSMYYLKSTLYSECTVRTVMHDVCGPFVSVPHLSEQHRFKRLETLNMLLHESLIYLHDPCTAKKQCVCVCVCVCVTYQDKSSPYDLALKALIKQSCLEKTLLCSVFSVDNLHSECCCMLCKWHITSRSIGATSLLF